MPYIAKFAARSAFAEWLGTGRKDAFKNGANVDPSDLRKFGVELGQFFEYDNHIWRGVRARGAITAAGYSVKNYFGAAARTGAAQAPFSKNKLVTTDTFVRGDLKGGRVWDVSGTSFGFREILENDDAAAASVITVTKRVDHLNRTAANAADAFTATPDGTSNYHVHCDWEVTQTTAATDWVEGISLGAVTDGNLTIVLVEGPYVPIFCAGNVNALTAGGGVVPSATSGVSKGMAAGPTAAEVMNQFAWSYDAYAGAGGLRICRVPGRFAVGGQRNIHVL